MKKLLVCIAIAAFSAASACLAADGLNAAPAAAAVPYRTLTPQEAKLQMDQQTNLVVVDVRTQEEYAAGHIPSAVLLPVEQIEAKASSVAKVLSDKTRKSSYIAAAASAPAALQRR